MRLAQTRPSAFEALTDELRETLSRRIGQFVGSALLAIAALLGLALSSWSVTDPSLNHATDAPVRNLVGAPGALVADLLMQTVGLASMAMLVPLTVWGLSLLARRNIDRERARLVAFCVGTVLVAAALATFPRPAGWPLPTGLGGAGGDLMLNLTRALLGGLSGDASTLLAGIAFTGGGLWAFFFASGLRQAEDQEHVRPERPSARPAHEPARAFVPAPEPEEDEAEDEAPRRRGLFKTAAGSLAGAKAMFAGWRAPAEDDLPEEGPFERREPSFDDAGEPVRRLPARGRVAAPEPDDEDDGDDTAFLFADEEELDEVEPEPAPKKGGNGRAAEPAAKARVRPAPLAPVPGAVSTKRYEHPSLTLLKEPKPRAPGSAENPEALRENARLLEQTLDDFGVRGEILNAKPGPVVTLYELQPAPGIKSSRVIGLADDIARSMSAVATRVATVPGRNVIGIELPNAKRETVWLREMFASKDFTDTKARLPLALGKSIGGETVIADLARMPHLLIAGTTGSGKSVGINTMILSLLYRLSPEQCRLIMVDPKMLELSIYDGIPHLLTPVVTDPKKAVVALKWAVREMEDRYKKMSKVGVRNIDGFNERVAAAKSSGEGMSRTVQTGFDAETGEAVFEREEMALEPLPYIVVIVDEMADLMMVAGKDIEGAIQRLAQMARAAGIHIITATQRPSVDVITGTIKANFPTRISFQVTSKIDSRTILGEMGAEQLLGQGDMLCMMGGGKISRVHGPFVSDEEVAAIVEHLKAQGTPTYLDAITADDGEEIGGESAGGSIGGGGGGGGDDSEAGLYEQAVAVVVRDKKASTSYVQRRLQIGYNRAASLIERMEKEGVVGPPNHAGKREILVEGDD